MRRRRRMTEAGALLVLVGTVVAGAGLSFAVSLDGFVDGAAAGIEGAADGAERSAAGIVGTAAAAGEARASQGLPLLVRAAQAATRHEAPGRATAHGRPVGPDAVVAPQSSPARGEGGPRAEGLSLAALVNGALAGAAVVALALVRAGRRGMRS